MMRPFLAVMAGMLLGVAGMRRARQLRVHAANHVRWVNLLSHLSLLFVPAGVGILVAASSGSGHWIAILASLVVSTVLALAVTGLILRRMDSADKAGRDGNA